MSNREDFVTERNGVLTKYVGAGGDVVLPEGVTKIGDNAFKGCKKLTSVTIPKGVTEIGKYVFGACPELRSVEIPEGVTSIGELAFWYCEGLTELVIPSTVTEIGKQALGCCSSLATLTIQSENIKGVSAAFFGGTDVCFHVKSMTVIPAAMRVQAACRFVDHMEEYDEQEKAMYYKYIKSNAAKLVDHAAANPAFMQILCSEKMITAKTAPAYLEAVQKGGNAEAIAMMLEYNAKALTAQSKLRAEQKKEVEEETVIERKILRQEKKGIDGATLVLVGSSFETFKSGEIKTYIEANGGIIGKTVSAKTDYLVVRDLESGGDKKAKAEALGIEVITERQLNEMTGRVFEIDAKNTLVRYYGVGGNLVIPDNVVKIGKKAFEYCTVLTSVTIPEKVKEIGISAFKGCSNLTSVSFPAKLKKIGNYAFSDCRALQTVTIPGKVAEVGNMAFSGCSALTSVKLEEGVVAVSQFAFSGCTSLTSVTLPASLHSIEQFAFASCHNLTALTIPADVSYINSAAFFERGNLTIRGKAGSYAETYAKEQEIAFLEI